MKHRNVENKIVHDYLHKVNQYYMSKDGSS